MNDFKIYILFVIGLIIFSVWLLPQLRNTIDDVDSDPEPEWTSGSSQCDIDNI